MSEKDNQKLSIHNPTPKIVVEFLCNENDSSKIKDAFLKKLSDNGCNLELTAENSFGFKILKKLPKRGNKNAWLVEFRPQVIESKEKEVRDFKDSEVFYKHCKKNKTVRVVSDQYSIERSQKLYPKLANIETYFRELALEQYASDLSKYEDKNRGSGNHLVAWLEATTLFSTFFLSKASNDYFLNKIEHAESKDEKRKAYHSNKLDELGFPALKNVFEELGEIRNTVMHFRLISNQDYEDWSEKLDQIENAIEQQETLKILQNIKLPDFAEINKQMQKTMEDFKNLDLAVNFNATKQAMNEAIDALNRNHEEIIRTFRSMGEIGKQIKLPSTDLFGGTENDYYDMDNQDSDDEEETDNKPEEDDSGSEGKDE